MIIAAVKLSDIELDVDAERPNQAEPERYVPATGQVASFRIYDGHCARATVRH